MKSEWNGFEYPCTAKVLPGFFITADGTDISRQIGPDEEVFAKLDPRINRFQLRMANDHDPDRSSIHSLTFWKDDKGEWYIVGATIGRNVFSWPRPATAEPKASTD